MTSNTEKKNSFGDSKTRVMRTKTTSRYCLILPQHVGQNETGK